jgi:ABC-type phosphate transport system substrate-binding protein
VRIIRSLVAVSAIAATATALAVVPALADPVNSKYQAVTPNAWDVVTAGSATTQYVVDQLAYNYDKGLSARHVKDTPSNPYIYSWDAVNPKAPGSTTVQNIKTKRGCGTEARPGSSGAGIKSLAGFGKVSYTYKGKKGSANCVDFARSSRTKSASDPSTADFVVLGQDAVTYAVTTPGNTPHGLTQADLKGIFSCTPGFTNWNDFGGPNATIDPVIPETSSGTESFFYGVLGLPTSGETEPACGTLAGVTTNLFEENEGVNAEFYNSNNKADGVNKNIITLFSIGSYIDQSVHGKACGAKPKKGQNEFGCNQVGVLHLGAIAPAGKTTGVAPTAKIKGAVVINPSFPGIWKRFLFSVVTAVKGSNPIPFGLRRFLDPYKAKHAKSYINGYFCSPGQQSTLENYGFLPSKACGLVIP